MSRRTKYAAGIAVVPAGPRPPAFAEVAARLRVFGAAHPKIACLEVFGSVADGDAGPGSDVDVLVTFHRPREVALSDLFALEDALAATLGCPVDLLERTAVERSPNPFRRAAILESARPVYKAAATATACSKFRFRHPLICQQISSPSRQVV